MANNDFEIHGGTLALFFEPTVVTKRRVESEHREYNLPKQIGNHNGAPETQARNVLYGYDVKEKDIIPGMIHFLDQEIELIYASLNKAYPGKLEEVFEVHNAYDDALHRIPIIVRSNTPVEECCDKDPWKVIEDIKKQKNLSPEDYKKCVTELVDQCHFFSKNITGLYHSAGAENLPECEGLELYWTIEEKCPYIEIFYRNISEKGEDRFAAGLAATISHELFHFLHDQLVGSEAFNKASLYRDPVTESSADFFSVFHLVCSQYGTDRLPYAHERYDEWKKNAEYGSLWPYAYALYYFQVNGNMIPFLDDAADYKASGCIEKLQKVSFESEFDMEFAFKRLISL